MSNVTKILTVFVFLLSLIPLLWFPGKTILLGYDNVYPLSPIPFLYDRVHSWSWVIGFGSDQSAIQGSLLIHLLDVVPQLLGFSYQTSQKIVYSFWFFLILLSAYVLARVLEKNSFITSPYVKFFFPVLYAINFYTLQAWWIAERTKFSLLVATPLILSLIIPMMKKDLTIKGVVKNAVLSSLVLFVFNGGGWLGISLFGGLLVLLLSFYLFNFFMYIRAKRYTQILLLHLFFIFFALGFMLLNAYTIFPFFFTTLFEYSQLLQRSGGLAGITGWTRYLSEHTSIINLLRLQGIPDWYNSSYHAYSSTYLRNPFFVVSSFVIPILLFFSFLTKKVEKNFLKYLLFSLVLTLFFSAGIHVPFGGIFELMMKIPGFVIFRSAIFKFGYSYWLIVSLLVSIGLSEGVTFFSEKFSSKFRSAVFSTIFSCLIIVLILLYHFPFLTGNFFHVDKYYASSQVTLPSYVSEFSQWWESKGTNSRILLLPRLNSDWYFEVYKWNYLSLNPVLANFGNQGIVENSVLLTPGERDLVSKLYDGINEGDSAGVSSLTSSLGIRYLLLRKDFANNYPGVETDDPVEIEKKLRILSGLSKVKEYGAWVIYRFSDEKPIFSTSTIAHVTGGSFVGDSPENKIVYLKEKPSAPVSRLIVYPTCVSCTAEQATTPVQFPKPKILLDSNLYKLVELREKMTFKKHMTFDDGLFQTVGESLKYASQIKELIERDRGDYYVHLAREKYLIALTTLEQRIPSILSQSVNPYSTSIILQDYSQAQMKFLKDLVLKTGRNEQQIDLELIMNQLEINEVLLKEIMKQEDVNRVKIYSVSIHDPGVYKVTIDKNSLGVINNPMEIRVNTADRLLSPVDEGRLLRFGEILFPKGKTELSLILPAQQSVLLSAESKQHAGRACFDSTIRGFRLGKVYRLEFVIRNNFDPNFLFYADDALEYNPKLLGYFPVAGEELKNQRYILSSATVPMKKTAKTLRIGFCAPSLTRERFVENVRGLQVTELTSPVISLTKDSIFPAGTPPTITVERKGYADYRVRVQNATSPYFLTFSSQHSPSWQATVGNHMVGNQFQNTWYIDKTGTYDVDVAYDAQKYFWIGLVVSIISLFLSIGIIYTLRRSR